LVSPFRIACVYLHAERGRSFKRVWRSPRIIYALENAQRPQFGFFSARSMSNNDNREKASHIDGARLKDQSEPDMGLNQESITNKHAS
jgi:hypothetical protein